MMTVSYKAAKRQAPVVRPTFSLVRRECSCGGTGDDCNRKDDTRHESVAPVQHNFSDIGVHAEAAFGPCPSDDVKCQGPGGPGPSPAPPPGGPAPAPPGSAPAAPAPIVHTDPNISWPAAGYITANTNAASTTVERNFNVTYRSIEDIPNDRWTLDVVFATGGVDITVNTGGSRDPIANPPTSEAEAQDAVTVMKGYYARGSRGSWHTEAASKAHEEHHYSEWQCSADDYWRSARWRANQMITPRTGSPNEAAAIATMRAGPRGADALMTSFQAASRAYWMTLADNASSRPYAAGQLVLNNAIQSVQTLAAAKGWAVDQGVATPSAANPCYLAKPLWPW